MAKIFGSWAVDLADGWVDYIGDDGGDGDADLREVKSTVEKILEALTTFSGHRDFEVQERVGFRLVLFFRLVRFSIDRMC